jgi:hypothetical protein
MPAHSAEHAHDTRNTPAGQQLPADFLMLDLIVHGLPHWLTGRERFARPTAHYAIVLSEALHVTLAPRHRQALS